MSPVVRQFIVGAARADAITNMALDIHRELTGEVRSEIYAFHAVEEALTDQIRPRTMMPSGAPDDVFIYHSSFGIPAITKLLMERTEKLILAYHNITPSDRYWDFDPEFAASLEWGRKELEIVRPRVVKAIADSRFNASELEALGYEDVSVIPAGLDPFRFRETPIDTAFNLDLDKHFPEGFILFVSQSIPHKRVEMAMEVVHLVRSIHRQNIGLVIAGPQRNAKYRTVLSGYRRKLPEANVLVAGEVSESMLATLYRKAIMLLGTSDHEGFGAPPLEAMAENCPVVIRGCGAVPETVGRGGLVLPCDASVLELTEAVAAVIASPQLRLQLISAGCERVAEFASDRKASGMSEILRNAMS